MSMIFTRTTQDNLIKEHAEARGISHLVHFTRLENLDTILSHGLMGRVQLENADVNYEYNDCGRYDGIPEAVCLSVSFPNYKMFYKYRQEDQCANWVVLLLDPKILWEKECLFCKLNAATNEMSYQSKEDRKGVDAFESMFENPELRNYLDLPSHYTTNPQAEILVLDRIEKEYINQVLFHDDHSFGNQKLLQDLIDKYQSEKLFFKDNCNPSYFSWREDYRHWKKCY